MINNNQVYVIPRNEATSYGLANANDSTNTLFVECMQTSTQTGTSITSVTVMATFPTGITCSINQTISSSTSVRYALGNRTINRYQISVTSCNVPITTFIIPMALSCQVVYTGSFSSTLSSNSFGIVNLKVLDRPKFQNCTNDVTFFTNQIYYFLNRLSYIVYKI